MPYQWVDDADDEEWESWPADAYFADPAAEALIVFVFVNFLNVLGCLSICFVFLLY